MRPRSLTGTRRHVAAALIALACTPESHALQIVDAVSKVLDGDVWVPNEVRGGGAGLRPDEASAATQISGLTPQQFRVFSMIADGLLNKQIAYELGVSEATVKAHMTAIMRKLGAHSRTQVALLAARLAIDP